ncbi:response regulator [Dongshaea marina]|uniref:response regulator n=1 Tax=Dongshaea marina TaxID=2047966 RepID=UPI000D3E3523|nr:response regulator [Dongshaea marina]
MLAKILLVEDDTHLSQLICEYLIGHDYQVTPHLRGDTAVEAIAELQPDLIILDVMLPGKSGLEICKEIRGSFHAPIMMMTACSEDVDQILGLELGADDYVAKPVEPRVLLARVRALLRRHQSTSAQPSDEPELLDFGTLRINRTTRLVTVSDKKIELTTAEFDLLWLLATHAGDILSRDQLMNKLRGVGFDGLDRTIDARISRLRRSLGDSADSPVRIKTVRNKGYLFSKEVD